MHVWPYLQVHKSDCCVVCLQEGAGHAVMSAYVEVVFDNSDGRFPVRVAIESAM